MCDSIEHNDVVVRIQEVRGLLETVSCGNHWEKWGRDSLFNKVREVELDADNHFLCIDTGEDPQVFMDVLDDTYRSAEELVHNAKFNINNLCYAAKDLTSTVTDKGVEIALLVGNGTNSIAKTAKQFISENKTMVKAGVSVGVAGGVAVKMIHDGETDGVKIAATSAVAGAGSYCALSAISKFITGEW